MSANFLPSALRVSAGGIVWVLHFAVLYGVTAVACARGAAHGVAGIIGVTTFVALGACGFIVRRAPRHRDDFEGWLSAALACVAAMAIVFEALPILVISPCG